MAFDARHGDKNREISRKHGNTLIRTLRRTYGSGFAPGCADDMKLSIVLSRLDDTSLSHLIRDHEAGYLYQICRAASPRSRKDRGEYRQAASAGESLTWIFSSAFFQSPVGRAHAPYNLSRGIQSATTHTMHTIRTPIAT
jgi:hypothetical protein